MVIISETNPENVFTGCKLSDVPHFEKILELVELTTPVPQLCEIFTVLELLFDGLIVPLAGPETEKRFQKFCTSLYEFYGALIQKYTLPEAEATEDTMLLVGTVLFFMNLCVLNIHMVLGVNLFLLSVADAEAALDAEASNEDIEHHSTAGVLVTAMFRAFRFTNLNRFYDKKCVYTSQITLMLEALTVSPKNSITCDPLNILTQCLTVLQDSEEVGPESSVIALIFALVQQEYIITTPFTVNYDLVTLFDNFSGASITEKLVAVYFGDPNITTEKTLLLLKVICMCWLLVSSTQEAFELMKPVLSKLMEGEDGNKYLFYCLVLHGHVIAMCDQGERSWYLYQLTRLFTLKPDEMMTVPAMEYFSGVVCKSLRKNAEDETFYHAPIVRAISATYLPYIRIGIFPEIVLIMCSTVTTMTAENQVKYMALMHSCGYDRIVNTLVRQGLLKPLPLTLLVLGYLGLNSKQSLKPVFLTHALLLGLVNNSASIENGQFLAQTVIAFVCRIADETACNAVLTTLKFFLRRTRKVRILYYVSELLLPFIERGRISCAVQDVLTTFVDTALRINTADSAAAPLYYMTQYKKGEVPEKLKWLNLLKICIKETSDNLLVKDDLLCKYLVLADHCFKGVYTAEEAKCLLELLAIAVGRHTGLDQYFLEMVMETLCSLPYERVLNEMDYISQLCFISILREMLTMLKEVPYSRVALEVMRRCSTLFLPLLPRDPAPFTVTLLLDTLFVEYASSTFSPETGPVVDLHPPFTVLPSGDRPLLELSYDEFTALWKVVFFGFTEVVNHEDETNAIRCYYSWRFLSSVFIKRQAYAQIPACRMLQELLGMTVRLYQIPAKLLITSDNICGYFLRALNACWRAHQEAGEGAQQMVQYVLGLLSTVITPACSFLECVPIGLYQVLVRFEKQSVYSAVAGSILCAWRDRKDEHLAAVEVSPPKKARLAERVQGRCIICLDKACVVVLLPCGHLVLCDECSEKTAPEVKCPMCRGTVQSKARVYTSG